MPKLTTYTRSAIAQAVMHQVDRRSPSYFLPKSYWPENTDGDRIANAGAVLAKLTGGLPESEMTGAQGYLVPYSESGAYGTGSDTAFGILDQTYDETYSDWLVTVVTSGIAFQKYCYIPGGTQGDITAAAKTDLANIEWR